MENKTKRSSKKVNIVPYVAFTCLFVLVNLGLYAGMQRLSAENQMVGLEETNSTIVSDIEDAVFLRMKDMTKSLAESPQVKSFLAERTETSYHRGRIALDTAQRISGASICYVLDMGGTAVLSTKVAEDPALVMEGVNFSFRPYFQNAAGGKDVIYPALGVVTEERGIYFSSPVFSGSSQVMGVVVIKIGVKVIDQILSGSADHSILTTDEGIVFSTDTPEWLYRHVAPLSQEKLEELKKNRQFFDRQLLPLDFTLDSSRVTINGITYHISKKPVAHTGWSVYTLKSFSGICVLTPSQKRLYIEINTIFVALFLLLLLLNANISRRKRSEEQLNKLYTAVEQSPSAVTITDTGGNIEYVNPKFKALTGYTQNELLGKNIRIFKSGFHPPEFYKNLWNTIRAGKEWKGEFCNRKKSGELYWESSVISPVRNRKGTITHFIALKEDITEHRKLQEKLNLYATTDGMTGGLNRRTCITLLENLIKQAKRHRHRLVVCFADINGLKSVNDTFGHNHGDDLILTVVNTARKNIRESDSLCRVGGDEFLILFPDCRLDEAEEIWKRIEADLEEINGNGAKPFLVSAGHGFAEYDPSDEMTVDDLINLADKEMYRNKKAMKEALGSKGVLR